MLATRFALFSAEETASFGLTIETPVSENYNREISMFAGKIDKVTINLK